MLTIALAAACARKDAEVAKESSRGLTASVTVEPFHAVAPLPATWAAEAFAESVATHLGQIRGLRVAHGPHGRQTDFALRGEVTVRDRRLVMATRLWRSDESSAVWTGTFWRDDGPNRNLVQDLAAAVAEALYADVARRALTSKEQR